MNLNAVQQLQSMVLQPAKHVSATKRRSSSVNPPQRAVHSAPATKAKSVSATKRRSSSVNPPQRAVHSAPATKAKSVSATRRRSSSVSPPQRAVHSAPATKAKSVSATKRRSSSVNPPQRAVHSAPATKAKSVSPPESTRTQPANQPIDDIETINIDDQKPMIPNKSPCNTAHDIINTGCDIARPIANLASAASAPGFNLSTAITSSTGVIQEGIDLATRWNKYDCSEKIIKGLNIASQLGTAGSNATAYSAPDKEDAIKGTGATAAGIGIVSRGISAVRHFKRKEKQKGWSSIIRMGSNSAYFAGSLTSGRLSTGLNHVGNALDLAAGATDAWSTVNAFNRSKRK